MDTAQLWGRCGVEAAAVGLAERSSPLLPLLPLLLQSLPQDDEAARRRVLTQK